MFELGAIRHVVEVLFVVCVRLVMWAGCRLPWRLDRLWVTASGVGIFGTEVMEMGFDEMGWQLISKQVYIEGGLMLAMAL